MSDEITNLGNIDLSGLSGSTIGDITTHITAGGDIVGRDKVINNITNLIHQAVTAAEEAE
jgi:hypothetical protein